MQTFFTSDTHFGSERTLKVSRRPFSNVTEMDQKIIENWNKTVDKNDLVYHLGDFGDFNQLKKLNGKIILILGNYEKDDMNANFNGDFSKYKKYLKSKGFYDVFENGKIITLQNEKIYLTHKPSDHDKNLFTFFGHIHEKNFAKKFGLNVGIDCFHFQPASEEIVLFYKNAILNYYDDEVFCNN